jgi:hypothetical protein
MEVGEDEKVSSSMLDGWQVGQEDRQDAPNRGERESRMQTASARASIGSLERVRSAWTRGTEGVRRELDDGIKFVR